MFNKKEIERKYFFEVKEIFPDFPIGKIIDSEAPDFIIESKDKTIGVEVTRFYRKQSDRDVNDREIEAIQRKIVNIAQKFFQSKHNISLLVSPLWKIQNKLTREEINLLANALADIIESNIPNEIHKTINIENYNLWTTPLSNYCSFISIMKLRDKPRWISNGGGFPYVSKHEIVDSIEKKANKISGYLK